MVYKSINGLAPQYLHNLFIRDSSCNSYILRNTTDLKIPKETATNGQKSFSYRGVKLWNSLPNETKQSSFICAFKNNLYCTGSLSSGRAEANYTERCFNPTDHRSSFLFESREGAALYLDCWSYSQFLDFILAFDFILSSKKFFLYFLL